LGCGEDAIKLSKTLLSLDLAVVNRKVHFKDVLVQLASHVMRKKLELQKNQKSFILPPKEELLGGKLSEKAIALNQEDLLSEWTKVKVSFKGEVPENFDEKEDCVGDILQDFNSAYKSGFSTAQGKDAWARVVPKKGTPGK
jgi:hypothetical protein